MEGGRRMLVKGRYFSPSFCNIGTVNDGLDCENEGEVIDSEEYDAGLIEALPHFTGKAG